MTKQVARAAKSMRDLSPAELRAEIERISGLPCPPEGAPNEDELWAEHEVASNFLMLLRDTQDPDAARREAAAYTLQNHAQPIEKLAPHIERGLGRKLLDVEIRDGVLFD